jgi:hypothetical protein
MEVTQLQAQQFSLADISEEELVHLRYYLHCRVLLRSPLRKNIPGKDFVPKADVKAVEEESSSEVEGIGRTLLLT